MIADGLQRTLRHPDLRLLDRESLFGQSLRNIEVGNRTKQAAVNTGFLRNLNGKAGEFFALSLRLGQLDRSGLFEFDALRFELGNRAGRGAACHALRNQEVAGIPILDANYLTEIAEINDFFQQNDLHIFLRIRVTESVVNYAVCRS